MKIKGGGARFGFGGFRAMDRSRWFLGGPQIGSCEAGSAGGGRRARFGPVRARAGSAPAVVDVGEGRVSVRLRVGASR